MFDFLKKKISGFTEKLKETIQGKTATQSQQQAAEEQKELGAGDAIAIGTRELVQEAPAEKQVHKGRKNAPESEEPPSSEDEKPKVEGKKRGKTVAKREMKAKTGLLTKIGGFLGGKTRISETDTKEFFEEFELSLLEADVEQSTAAAIVEDLKKRLVGMEVSGNTDLTLFLKDRIREALLSTMETCSVDLFSTGKKPAKVLFLGPNGAGKTTTIAKIAKLLTSKGKTCILAAADTFRAASIEQLETHATRLGVKVVKHKYGSDPAAVAFDAVKSAEAKGLDFVLIDTAGRQETNANLLNELRKISRVVQPDLKIYVGEAYTGQALLEQAVEFDAAIGIDGFILTKIDMDAKGGTAISLLHRLKKPILFVGTGQGYDGLEEFKPRFIIDRIL